MGRKRRRRPFEAGPRRVGCGPRLDGEAVQTRERALQEGFVERHLILAFDQGAAQRAQPLDRTARGRIERDMQGHGQRRARGKRAGCIVQQQLFGGRMAHVSSFSFSNVSRSRPRARRMRDFTVPNGSFSSSAMAVWVLSSKNAFWITTN